jgi:propionate CoA-transferase
MPVTNPKAIVAMNQMLDFYDGGGLHMVQILASGNVIVSRMSVDRLNGPGGFVDTFQSTKAVCFRTTAKGFETTCIANGALNIVQEGVIKKFVHEVFEITFSEDEAV